MPTVWVPASFRGLTQGQETVTVSGATVRQVIDDLERRFPGIKDRLCGANGLRSGIAVAVDTEIAALGMLQPVRAESEIHFLPAISGGAGPTSNG